MSNKQRLPTYHSQCDPLCFPNRNDNNKNSLSFNGTETAIGKSIVNISESKSATPCIGTIKRGLGLLFDCRKSLAAISAEK